MHTVIRHCYQKLTDYSTVKIDNVKLPILSRFFDQMTKLVEHSISCG